MKTFGDFYRGKRILLTGHTGFKGAWLSEWLLALGARVTGYSLPPSTSPSLFEQLGLAGRLDHRLLDITDRAKLAAAVCEVEPDVVFHLAAQPLVRQSYSEPVETFATNVMGTVHLLDALRSRQKRCVAIFVTTDKCYENREWLHGYRESDPMGGYDPYSASKGCAELVIAAYRRSFFPPQREHPVAVASARAGNVLGGGDWATDRILPDCVRALMRGDTIRVRNPHATRPWQHVLEPLSGYLCLGARLGAGLGMPGGAGKHAAWPDLVGAFNFGPNLAANQNVEQVVREVITNWPGKWEMHPDASAPHEAGKLSLATDKAFHLLGWRPVWDFQQTIARTIEWYRDAHERRGEPRELAQAQIAGYCADAEAVGVPWVN